MSDLEISTFDEARERLIDQILGASSLPEISAAAQALSKWLIDHPDESGMADGFELLSHRADSAREKEADCVPALETPLPSLAHV